MKSPYITICALPEREFTAQYVKFTFDCILNEYVEAAALRSYYVERDEESGKESPNIQVTVIDKHTVKVKWMKPYFMADDYTLYVQMLPRHVYSVDENGETISFDFRSKEFADGFNNHWANRTLCGTGPLIFKEWNAMKTIGANLSISKRSSFGSSATPIRPCSS